MVRGLSPRKAMSPLACRRFTDECTVCFEENPRSHSCFWVRPSSSMRAYRMSKAQSASPMRQAVWRYSSSALLRPGVLQQVEEVVDGADGLRGALGGGCGAGLRCGGHRFLETKMV